MGGIATVDELDRRITTALQLNGRASWRTVAEAVGSTESTVARRGQALLESRLVGVTGVLDHLRCGLGISLIVRLRCRPGRAEAVAEALTGLRETRFVTLVSGSIDVACELVVTHHADVTRVLVAQLPRPEDIVDTESVVVVRKFSAFEEWDPGLLDPEAAAALRPPVTFTDHRGWHDPERLTESELAVAAVLARDGRASYTQLASATGTSESTAARRVESLVSRGCLRFRTLFETGTLGLDVDFMQWLTVEPACLAEVGARLAQEPAVRYVSATTGRFNLVLHGTLPGYGDLYDFLTTVIGALPGVHTTDMTLQSRTLKRAWARIDEEGRWST